MIDISIELQSKQTLHQQKTLPPGQLVTLAYNKMELLQSQAPVDWKLSGSSASARHGTSDIGN